MTIPAYDLYRTDHPSNVKRGDVRREGLYLLYFLLLKVIEFNIYLSMSTSKRESGKNIMQLHCFISFTNQSQDHFETFLKNVKLSLDIIFTNNPFLAVVLGDFNVTSKNHMKDQESMS